ncbi:MAG: hypothetical protein IOC63_18590 [Methylobacterium sp.]|jgi:hypothetical protein|nr:hypothetical protein [Methylobacterium sp.]MCA3602783.1 hypothetical protein [Methylobacterium sp.]MCA3612322.1 hypothetical protein [Methylobacterium sp.]MCA3615705.1 hypothetical protein [Methylobacterium sp.]MCA3624851.1 hypothetical protein [Methylobacterium sp.]
MARYLGQVALGCLIKDDLASPRPSRPWLIDLSLLKPPFPVVPGDIADFETAPDFARWQLGDTPASPAHQLLWNEIDDDGRRLLISDRVILARVSWDDLDAAGYVAGRRISIDGKAFRCRLLTGGQDFRTGKDGFDGASPRNEWDRFIGGDEPVEGLPPPKARDGTRDLSDVDLASAHNRIWNWLGAVSWTQEPYLHRATARCCRGYHSARFFYLNTQSHRHEDIGWRPVLEAL